ncbi:hypothetical protein OPV22_003856 [Ensete ventricosum]|uniref:Uncharacterized protein n=1 Tax=Ensete ventricosum TaxID=4639 RepID=A0AAV8S1R4_ENSVE|nr:hypothetical protein OPV22_003856 [Ensete ventricosum]
MIGFMRFGLLVVGSPRCRSTEQTGDYAVSAATRSGSGTMATCSLHASSADSLFAGLVTSSSDERETRPVRSAPPVTSATKDVEGDDDDDFEEEFQIKIPKKSPDNLRFDVNSENGERAKPWRPNGHTLSSFAGSVAGKDLEREMEGTMEWKDRVEKWKARQERKGLSNKTWRKVPIPSSRINPYRIVIVLRLLILVFFFRFRFRITTPATDAYALWLTSVICEIWFALSWILDQFPKWFPITRETYLDRLSMRFQHHKKAGAMNALVRVSAVLTNAPFLLNLDCDHYINNSKAVREAMCFLMDPQLGKKLCYVQFPQRFDGIDRHDRYANRNVVFFDINMKGLDGIQGPVYVGTGCGFNRQALYGYDPPKSEKRPKMTCDCWPSWCCRCCCCGGGPREEGVPRPVQEEEQEDGGGEQERLHQETDGPTWRT